MKTFKKTRARKISKEVNENPPKNFDKLNFFQDFAVRVEENTLAKKSNVE